MTEIYIIRHAQAVGNRYHMMQGHWDGEVTALGRRQIEELAVRFRALPLDAVYSSDLSRALLTAEAVARRDGLPVRPDPALREINMGSWEKKFWGNLKWQTPDLAGQFIHDPDHWHVEGAETYAQVAERAFSRLCALAQAHEGQRIGVVSHGVTLRCLLSKALDISLQETRQLPIAGNTAVSLLRWENGRFTPVYLNDDSHLSTKNAVVWGRAGDLRDEPLDPRRDAEYYAACYADAWQLAHGDLGGFFPDPYFEAACRHLREHPGAVLRIYDEGTRAGLLDLDPFRGAHAGYGWISFLYLEPAFRGRGCGVQLLARAYSVFEELGRRSVRLHAAEDNAAALAFYRREGFRELGREPGNRGTLLLMEKKLGGQDHA